MMTSQHLYHEWENEDAAMTTGIAELDMALNSMHMYFWSDSQQLIYTYFANSEAFLGIKAESI